MATYRVVHYVATGLPTSNIRYTSEEKFSQNVQAWLNQGYELQGGISLSVASLVGGFVEYTYAQAVIKK